MRRSSSLGFAALGVTGIALQPAALVARAEVYQTDDQAAQLIFPGETFVRRELKLTADQAAAIEKASDQNVRNHTLTALVTPSKGVVFVDKVIGKHELITIAVGVGSDGAVRGVEILEYRETYGYQVKNPEWRKQFSGKTAQAPLKVGSDIKNISGATLSSVHVAGGVKRLLNTYDVLRSTL